MGHRPNFSAKDSGGMREFRSGRYEPGLAGVKQSRIKLHPIPRYVLLVIGIGFGFRIEELAVQIEPRRRLCRHQSSGIDTASPDAIGGQETIYIRSLAQHGC